jgi:dihydroneopterin aldolase/2-amino-4-hydroxy-6-hydroxymethyldihydropteridine diphosphokinase
MIIRIKQLKTYSLIGIRPEEYTQRQPLIMDMEFHYDYTTPKVNDREPDFIDYVALEQFAKDYVESRHHGLLEDLAHVLLEEIMSQHPAIEVGKVVFSKPNALFFSDTVEVEHSISRNRP